MGHDIATVRSAYAFFTGKRAAASGTVPQPPAPKPAAPAVPAAPAPKPTPAAPAYGQDAYASVQSLVSTLERRITELEAALKQARQTQVPVYQTPPYVPTQPTYPTQPVVIPGVDKATAEINQGLDKFSREVGRVNQQITQVSTAINQQVPAITNQVTGIVKSFEGLINAFKGIKF